jgi:hypothetical protein
MDRRNLGRWTGGGPVGDPAGLPAARIGNRRLSVPIGLPFRSASCPL